MALPQTLAGISGFIIFIAVVLGITAADIFPEQTTNIQDTQTNMINVASSMTNGTQEPSTISSILGIVGLDAIYQYITNFLYIMGSFIVLFFQYLLMFLGIALLVPPEFYVFFAVMGMTSIIAILKLIFLSGD